MILGIEPDENLENVKIQELLNLHAASKPEQIEMDKKENNTDQASDLNEINGQENDPVGRL